MSNEYKIYKNLDIVYFLYKYTILLFLQANDSNIGVSSTASKNKVVFLLNYYAAILKFYFLAFLSNLIIYKY